MRRWLTSNLLLKLLSLLVAAGIWMWVTGEEKLEFTFPAPLVLQNLPARLALAAPPPDQVMVRLRAPEALLKRLAAGDIDARIDLAGLGAGEHLFPLTADRVRVPFGAEVIKVNPESVSLTLDPRVLRQIPVEARLEGQLPAGMGVARVIVDPPRVAVEGPERAVAAIRHVSTERLSLEGRDASFVASSAVVAGHPLLRIVSPLAVTVRVQIAPAGEYNSRRRRRSRTDAGPAGRG